jgi:hypothetical protein
MWKRREIAFSIIVSTNKKKQLRGLHMQQLYFITLSYDLKYQKITK